MLTYWLLLQGIKQRINETRRHLASLSVVLPLFTIAAVRLCWRAGARRSVLRTPHPLGALRLWRPRPYAKRSDSRAVGHPDFNMVDN